MIKKALLRVQYEGVLTGGSGPSYIDAYIFKLRPNNDTLATVDADFLQFGNSSIQYNGDTAPYCGMLAMNSDMFDEKKHDRIKVWNPNTSAFGTGGAAAYIQPGVTRLYDLTPYLKKKALFDDNTQTNKNDNLWFVTASTQMDGSTVSGADTHQITYTIEYEYYD
jgi:hypothetical protein